VRDSDLLSLGEGQVPPRQRRRADRSHPATLTEPPAPHSRRQPGLRRSILAREPTSDRRPEHPPMLTPPTRRPTRRPHRQPSRRHSCPTSWSPHEPPPTRGVATTV
jgi:hypothetical protein